MNNEDIQVEPDGFTDNPQSGVPFKDFVILLSHTALQHIKEHADRHLKKEVGGLLVGNLWEEGEVTYVAVNEIIPSQAEGTYATLTFTAEIWIDLEQQRERLFPKFKKVGWYHSHLGCGVFLSSLDKFLHQSAFSLPWQIAFVYDPVISEYGFFRWHEDKLVPVDFYLASGGETFTEPRMSQLVSHRLRVLSDYLQSLSISASITGVYKRLQPSLDKILSEKLFAANLVEDTLNTIVTVAEIDSKSLSQAKVILKSLLGKQLLLDQNVDPVASLLFESGKMAISKENLCFVKGSEIFWLSLKQENTASVISITAQICDIAMNMVSLFALDYSGNVHVVPISDFERVAVSRSKESINTTASVSFKTITLSPSNGTQLRAITASENFLYLISSTEIWKLNLTDSPPIRPKVLDLSNLKGRFPIEAEALAVDAAKNVYVADVANSRVLQVRPDGLVEYISLGVGKVSIVTPVSLCVKGRELYILDATVRRIIVYDLESMAYNRHYNWGGFIGDNAIERLYNDMNGQVYFSAGSKFLQLYRLIE